MKNIQEQIVEFFRVTSVSQATLARESQVKEAFISRLKRGRSMDVWSKKADALREAMMRLDPDAARKVGISV